MKNLALAFLLLFPLFSVGQITLENTYNYSGAFTNLKYSGDKFFIMDVINSQCRIYNTDHTLWKTINLSVPTNNYLYDIKFLSENLFTADNALCLAYVYYYYDEVNQYYTFNAKVIRENGTVLLTVPGCQYLEIYKTFEGATKLITYSYDYSLVFYTVTTRVYNLPGSVTNIPGQLNESAKHGLFPAFPNPATTSVTIPYSLPSDNDNGILRLSDSGGRLILEKKVSNHEKKITVDVHGLPSGIYFYSIVAGNISESGKLVVE